MHEYSINFIPLWHILKILHTQATQDNQTRSQTEGCVRLCSKFSQKRLQHPYCLYLVPGTRVHKVHLLIWWWTSTMMNLIFVKRVYSYSYSNDNLQFIFAVIAVQLFNGKFFYCSDGSTSVADKCQVRAGSGSFILENPGRVLWVQLCGGAAAGGGAGVEEAAVPLW